MKENLKNSIRLDELNDIIVKALEEAKTIATTNRYYEFVEDISFFCSTIISDLEEEHYKQLGKEDE